MFKKLLLTSLALVAAIAAMARPVTPQEALARVERQQLTGGANRAPAASGMILSRTISTAKQTPALYLFENGQDMLIVSADDATANALLGYVEDARGEMPPVMQWWLDEYARQIEYIQETPAHYIVAPGVAQAPRATKASIAPLCSTKWNQDAPFNAKCPTISGRATMTGCVATACAQVMKYFKYPESGSGTITYTDNGTKRTLALSGTKFDWANMLDDYSGTYNTTQRNAVAFLMQACGYAANMNYGTSSSGAQSFEMLLGAKKYFNYNSKAFQAQRDNYTESEWNDLMYDNLKTVGPIYYSGYNALYEGHAFVVDGYSADDYFHLNWGWGGAYDGYFKLSALAPEGQGIGGSSGGGFDFGQGAFINFTRPDATILDVALPGPVTQTGSLKGAASGWTLTLTTSGVTTEGVAFYNSSGSTGDFEWGYKWVNITSGESEIVATEEVMENWEPNVGFRGHQFEIDLDNGTYRIYPMIRTYPDGEWKELVHRASCADYVTVEMGRLGIASVTDVPEADFTVTDFSLESKLFWGKPFQTKFTVANDSEVEIRDGLFPAIFTIDSNNNLTLLAQGNALVVTMAPGESKEFTFSTDMYVSKSSFTGAAYLGICSFSTGIVYQSVQVNVEKAPTTSTYTATKFSFVGNADNADANNLQFTCGLKCTKGYYADPLTVYIFPINGGTAVMIYNSPDTYFLDVNESAEATFGGAFPDATLNTRYEAIFGYVKSGYVNTLSSLYFTVKSEYSGVESVNEESSSIHIFVDPATSGITVDAPAAIASVELYAVDGRRVAADVDIEATTARVATTERGLMLIRVNLLNGDSHTFKVTL